VNISNRLLRGKLTCEKTAAIGYILTHENEFELAYESVWRDTYHRLLCLHTALGFNIIVIRSHPGGGAPSINEESVLGENVRPYDAEIYKTHSS
jgi:hypothetical protein